MFFLNIFNYFCFIFIFNITNAYAYIDPGGIGAIVNLIIAAIATSLFYLRIQLVNFSRNFLVFFKDLKNFVLFTIKKKEVVFYLETYQNFKYFGNIVENLLNSNFELTILSDKKIKQIKSNKNIKYFYIETEFFKHLCLNFIRCNITVLTTPDVGNSQVVKSKFCKHYFYLFHSVVSTLMVYKKNAFTNYDTVCCNGNYQLEELLKQEDKYNLPKKNLIKGGYPLFDILINKRENRLNYNKVLIAPSWNPEYPDLYNIYYSNIITILLEKNFQIIFKPHYEYFKRYQKNYKDFKKKYISLSNIQFLEKDELLDTFSDIGSLITDWSGVAYEYYYSTGGFVFFNDIPYKKLNTEAINIENIFEYYTREQIGYVLPKNNDELKNIFVNLSSKKLNRIEVKDFFKNNFYNLGNSSKFISNAIKTINENLKLK